MPDSEVPSPFQILDFVPGGCCVIGHEGAIRFWNQTLEVWTGRPAAGMVGANLFEAFPGLGQPRFRDRILAVLETGAPTLFSSALNPQFFPCTRTGGRPRIQQTVLCRLPLGPGGPLAMISVSDVTDQFERGENYRLARGQALEEARVRRESEDQLRLIIGLSSAAILVGGPNGHLLDCNDAAARIFLHPKKALLQLSLPELFPYKHSELLARLLREDLDTGDRGLELEGRRWNGTTFPAEIIAKFFTARDERRFVAYVHDLSERRRAEEALSYARRQESLGALAGGIAHDFNNLFCGALGNLDLSLQQVPEGSSLALHLERIRGEMLRASELSQKMLAFSGKGLFAPVTIDLNRLLEELKPRLSADVSTKATLRFRLAEDLPRLEGDPLQLQQLIQYLVANASEALEEQEGRIEITTAQEDLDAEAVRHGYLGQLVTPGPHVVLEVTDTGCGIPAENLPRIFEPFFSTKFAGRGLSLAVAQGILRSHKAAYAISSTVGTGTRFKLLFPVPPSAYPSHRPAPAVGSGIILFVDDEPVLREAAAEALELAGYEVLAARDGQEAVDLYREHRERIGLVVMDLTMPRMDGKAALQAILAMDPSARVVLSSGYTEHDAIQQLHGQGLAGFLPKPYRLAQLLETVARFVTAGNG